MEYTDATIERIATYCGCDVPTAKGMLADKDNLELRRIATQMQTPKLIPGLTGSRPTVGRVGRPSLAIVDDVRLSDDWDD